MPDLQELHWTNEPKAEQIHVTPLGYTAQTVYLLGPEPRAAQNKHRNIRTNATDGETRKNMVQ